MRSPDPTVSRGRFGAPLEELLLDRVWPAAIFALVLYYKLLKLYGTVAEARTSGRLTLELAADISHQLGAISVFAVVIALFIIRRPPVGARSSLLGAIVAIAGTTALGVTASAPVVYSPWPVLALSAVLALGGSAFTVFSLATLGRCFGLFPEARGLVTRGPYRFIRHPVYLGEYVSGFGLLLPILSPWSVAVYLVFAILQLWRIVNEERALEAVFPEYAQYRQRTWRLIPGVF